MGLRTAESGLQLSGNRELYQTDYEPAGTTPDYAMGLKLAEGLLSVGNDGMCLISCTSIENLLSACASHPAQGMNCKIVSGCPLPCNQGIFHPWQKTHIGADINTDVLVEFLRAAGVKRAEIRKPSYKIITALHIRRKG